MSGGNNSMAHLEIERKFLIEYPDEAALAAVPGARRYEIEQIYLSGDEDGGARIRRLAGDGGVEYFHTVKRYLTDLTRVEDERHISGEAYAALKALAGVDPMKIEKVRWRIPHGGLTVEVDIYPFWRRVALAEIELDSEDAGFSLPGCVRVIREVTHEKRYTNRALAAALRGGIPAEPGV